MKTTPFTVRSLQALLGLALLPFASFAQETPAPPPSDNEELRKLFEEDQADRAPEIYAKLGIAVTERDKARQDRIMEIYGADGLKTGADYFHAAMVMQHGGQTDSYLRAHEFSLAAVALGYEKARWLSAASYDRLLKSLGRPQRFGTQYSSKFSGGPQELHPVDDDVRDSLRQVLKVRPLAQAKAQEAAMTKRFAQNLKPSVNLVGFTPGKPPPAEFDVLDLNAGDMPPEITGFTNPPYPEALRAEKVYGTAIIAGVIERDGTLTQPKIARATHEAFGSAALAAVAGWQFKPGIKAGQPARVIVTIQANFAPPTAP